jgi:hypothetical protein
MGGVTGGPGPSDKCGAELAPTRICGSASPRRTLDQAGRADRQAVSEALRMLNGGSARYFPEGRSGSTRRAAASARALEDPDERDFPTLPATHSRRDGNRKLKKGAASQPRPLRSS